MQTKMVSHSGSGYGYGFGKGGYGKGGYGKGGGQDWGGGRRSRSGGRPGPSAWPPRQSPPGMGSAKTHRRSAQRSRSQARDREDAARWRQHVAAMPPTPPSPTLTPPSPPPPIDRLVQFPSPGSTLVTITTEAAPLYAAPDPPTPDAAPAPAPPTPGAHDLVMCDLCGGAGWLPGYVARRDWVRKA